MIRRPHGGLGWSSAWISCVLVAVLALRLGTDLWRFAVTSTTLPLWDMAQNAVAGLRLTRAVRGLDLVGLLRELHALSTWPPTWPGLEAAAFLVFGPSLAVARGLVAVIWILTVAATYWALRPVARGALGDAVGLLAAAWVAQAPLGQALATVNLLEIPGTFLLMLCLGCALRAQHDLRAGRRLHGERWWRATWAASLALFFLKYNYGLLWLLPLLLAEERRRASSWTSLARRIHLRLSALPWRRPWTIFVLLYVGLLLTIRFSGGIETEILGVALRANSIGNPVYVLFLLWILRRLLWGKNPWQRLRRGWRRLDARRHGMASWLVAPIGLWMLPPPHVKDFFGFVENRSSDLSRLESVTFYPRVVLEDFTRLPWLGMLAMVIALVGLSWLASVDGQRRLLTLTTLIGWLALLAHPYKLPRFATQAAILTGLLAAAWLVAALDRRPMRHGGRWTLTAFFAWASAAGICLWVAWAGIDLRTVETQHRARSTPAEGGIEARVAADVAVRGGIVLGTWNGLSPGLVEWQARTAVPVGEELEELDAGWRPVTTLDLDRRRDADAVIRKLAQSPCRSVAFLRSDQVGWSEENGWLAPVETHLRSAQGFSITELSPGLTVFRCSDSVSLSRLQLEIVKYTISGPN